MIFTSLSEKVSVQIYDFPNRSVTHRLYLRKSGFSPKMMVQKHQDNPYDENKLFWTIIKFLKKIVKYLQSQIIKITTKI